MPPRERKYNFTTEDEGGGEDDDKPDRPLLLSRSSSLTNDTTDEPTTRRKKPLVYDFVVFFLASLYITSYIEANAAAHQEAVPINDMGFEFTAPLYDTLRNNRGLNDALAFVNSFALFLPLVYSFYVTTFVGDYTLIFRIIFAQLLRSCCGWFTVLPISQQYLASNYDYPDIIHCMFQECSGEPQVMPFISFFSGHVVNMVICGNDLHLRGWRGTGLLAHVLNVFQIVRMLATRGHYTIDIIMGYIVAVYFSNGAAELGRSYSQGTRLFELLPNTVSNIFDMVTGISQVRASSSGARQDGTQQGRQDEQTETTPPKVIYEQSPSLAYSSSSSTN